MLAAWEFILGFCESTSSKLGMGLEGSSSSDQGPMMGTHGGGVSTAQNRDSEFPLKTDPSKSSNFLPASKHTSLILTSKIAVEVLQPPHLAIHLVPHCLLQGLTLGRGPHQALVGLREPLDFTFQL